VFVFTDSMDANELTHTAKRVEALGYSTLWYREAFKYEPLALEGFLFSQTTKLVVASGICNIYARRHRLGDGPANAKRDLRRAFRFGGVARATR